MPWQSSRSVTVPTVAGVTSRITDVARCHLWLKALCGKGFSGFSPAPKTSHKVTYVIRHGAHIVRTVPGSQRARRGRRRLSGMHTIDEAAASLGVSASTVRAWCDLAGLPVRRGARGRRSLTAGDMAQLEAVSRMRQAGQDMDIIRAALGVATESPQAVTTVTPLVGAVDSPSPHALIDRLAGTLEAAIGEGERWGAVLARLESLETELAATRDRLATLEAQHTQTVVRVTAQEGRRPRFGWVALSVAVAAMAGALLGRPVPVEAATSLRDLNAIRSDVRLLKVAVNTLATHANVLSARILLPHEDLLVIGQGPIWYPFPGLGYDKRYTVSALTREDAVLKSWAEFPKLRPATITSEDLCNLCEGVLPGP